MTFPAYNELMRDRAASNCARELFDWLVSQHPNSIHEEFAVKTEAAAAVLARHRETVGLALRWLIDHGYLLDCGRRATTHVQLVKVPFLRRQPTSCRQNPTGEQAA